MRQGNVLQTRTRTPLLIFHVAHTRTVKIHGALNRRHEETKNTFECHPNDAVVYSCFRNNLFPIPRLIFPVYLFVVYLLTLSVSQIIYTRYLLMV
jgi:hypothetical protein